MLNQPLLDERKHQLILGAIMCFNLYQIPTTKECLCYYELTTGKYYELIRLFIYLLTILQTFFIQLINKHAIIKLMLIYITADSL